MEIFRSLCTNFNLCAKTSLYRNEFCLSFGPNILQQLKRLLYLNPLETDPKATSGECISHLILILKSLFPKLSVTIFVGLETLQEFLSVSSNLVHINDSLWVGARYKSELGGYTWIASNTMVDDPAMFGEEAVPGGNGNDRLFLDANNSPSKLVVGHKNDIKSHILCEIC